MFIHGHICVYVCIYLTLSSSGFWKKVWYRKGLCGLRYAKGPAWYNATHSKQQTKICMMHTPQLLKSKTIKTSKTHDSGFRQTSHLFSWDSNLQAHKVDQRHVGIILCTPCAHHSKLLLKIVEHVQCFETFPARQCTMKSSVNRHVCNIHMH